MARDSVSARDSGRLVAARGHSRRRAERRIAKPDQAGHLCTLYADHELGNPGSREDATAHFAARCAGAPAAWIFGLFAGLALALLAVVGLY